MPKYKVRIGKRTYIHVKVMTEKQFKNNKKLDLSRAWACFYRHPEKFPIVWTIDLVDTWDKRISFDAVIHECAHLGIFSTEFITKYCKHDTMKVRHHLHRNYWVRYKAYNPRQLIQEIITYPVWHISACVVYKLIRRWYQFIYLWPVMY